MRGWLPRFVLCALLNVCLFGCGARSALDVDGMDASRPSDAGPPLIVFDGDLPDAPDPECLEDRSRCDDGDLCTLDDCLPAGRCASTPIRCDDGDACTVDGCDPTRGCFARPRDCDDGNVCTVDSCDPARGCVRQAVVCDDADPCTADRCDPQRGCVFEPTDCRGCADGQRDAFRDVDRYPNIAGCAGGFAIAGLSRELDPACARGAGDDGTNPEGLGCTAADLCAPVWHVCRSAGEVAARSADGCEGANDADGDAFFATRQTGPGCAHCATGEDDDCSNSSCRAGCAQTDGTTNDIFGCGTLGDVPVASSCGVLTRFSNNLCRALIPPWRCDDDPAGLRESDFVVKLGSEAGGVLCCPD